MKRITTIKTKNLCKSAKNVAAAANARLPASPLARPAAASQTSRAKTRTPARDKQQITLLI